VTKTKRENKNETSRNKTSKDWHFPGAVKDNELSYLVFQIAKAHRGLAGELLRPLGLYPGQELLLMQLWDCDGQSQTELILSLGLDASTVTKMVQRLEAQGHVVRKKSNEDKRSMMVSLTASGKRLRGDVEKMWASLNLVTTKNLSANEETQVSDFLKKIVSGLKDL